MPREDFVPTALPRDLLLPRQHHASARSMIRACASALGDGARPRETICRQVLMKHGSGPGRRPRAPGACLEAYTGRRRPGGRIRSGSPGTPRVRGPSWPRPDSDRAAARFPPDRGALQHRPRCTADDRPSSSPTRVEADELGIDVEASAIEEWKVFLDSQRSLALRRSRAPLGSATTRIRAPTSTSS